MSGICKIGNHGKFSGDQCPLCCLHAGEVDLSDGVKCADCLKPLKWVTANQLVNQSQTIQRERALADQLAGALLAEAVKRCRLCSEYDGIGAHRKIYEHVPTPGSDGRFFHRRHDRVDGGCWLCEAPEIRAVLAQHAALRAGKGVLPENGEPTSHQTPPEATANPTVA